MDTLQQAPALWYWSEPASGYSIEDCEQIVAEEMQTAKQTKSSGHRRGTLKCPPTVIKKFHASMDNSPANVQILRDAVSMHHCHESDHTPVEKPLPDQKNNPYTAKRAVLF